MAAARPLPDDPDAPARAELARLLLEGARRLRQKRERAESQRTDDRAPRRERRRREQP